MNTVQTILETLKKSGNPMSAGEKVPVSAGKRLIKQ
jgi:hypothetical protein